MVCLSRRLPLTLRDAKRRGHTILKWRPLHLGMDKKDPGDLVGCAASRAAKGLYCICMARKKKRSLYSTHIVFHYYLGNGTRFKSAALLARAPFSLFLSLFLHYLFPFLFSSAPPLPLFRRMHSHFRFFFTSSPPLIGIRPANSSPLLYCIAARQSRCHANTPSPVLWCLVILRAGFSASRRDGEVWRNACCGAGGLRLGNVLQGPFWIAVKSAAASSS